MGIIYTDCVTFFILGGGSFCVELALFIPGIVLVSSNELLGLGIALIVLGAVFFAASVKFFLYVVFGCFVIDLHIMVFACFQYIACVITSR